MKMTWAQLLKQRDILFAIAIALIIGMLLLPMPSFMIDVLITLNIALSVTIMMVTIYTNEPLQYSTFPIILLVSTLFRLGLNVSATRLILTQGSAGEVIHAFGSFVIGGNYLVGILIFTILVIINFIVITNGAGRVAEVAARFTLDAMPGKQLSIDADLNAGIIDDKEAKRRRIQIQKEADFYGTMDGASKFVKGDAMAAIIITVVNIIGGLIVGVFQQGMPIQEAVQHFTILTVGDGLVSQMPALVISAATGILVTRVSETNNELGEDIRLQMFTNPKVLGIVAALMGCMGVIPGMPNGPFLLVALLAGGASFVLVQNKQKDDRLAEEQLAQAQQVQEKVKKPGATTQTVMELLHVEPLELEIGYRLVPLLEAENGGDLLDRIAQIRRQMALELGLVLPSVRVRDNLQLPPNHYNIKLRGTIIDSGEVRSEMWLAMNTDSSSDSLPGAIETKEPAFGLPAYWVYSDQRENAEAAGYTVVSPSAVVATHVTEVVKRYSPDILTRTDVQSLLDNLKKTAEALVDDLIPDQLTVAELHVILQNLLRERVSIRDLTSILESLAYHSRVDKDKDYLTEQCRLALSRMICKQYLDGQGELPVVTLSPGVEENLANGLTEQGELLGLSPNFTQGLLNGINQEIEQVLSTRGVQPVLLCNGKLRMPLRRLIERMLPQIAVLSYNEIGPSIRATAVGMVDVEEQAIAS